MIEKPSLWERTEYDIISEKETDTEIVGIIRNRFNNAVIICNIPKHTKEEEDALASDITQAMVQTIFTKQDISHIDSMEILKE